MNTVIIAIVMGIMYWWCRGMILSYFGFLFISSPVTVGLVAGLLMGQPMQGLIIGGGIALVFAGIFARCCGSCRRRHPPARCVGR